MENHRKSKWKYLRTRFKDSGVSYVWGRY